MDDFLKRECQTQLAVISTSNQDKFLFSQSASNRFEILNFSTNDILNESTINFIIRAISESTARSVLVFLDDAEWKVLLLYLLEINSDLLWIRFSSCAKESCQHQSPCTFYFGVSDIPEIFNQRYKILYFISYPKFSALNLKNMIFIEILYSLKVYPALYYPLK